MAMRRGDIIPVGATLQCHQSSCQASESGQTRRESFPGESPLHVRLPPFGDDTGVLARACPERRRRVVSSLSRRRVAARADVRGREAGGWVV
jgi:hypothetical protein